MRLGHFDALKPICPACRINGAQERLRIEELLHQQDGHVLQARILCPACFREFPVIDGVPILLPDVRGYIQQNALALLMRQDLGAPLRSLVGDCLGPTGPYEQSRLYLSSYADEHWGDLEPDSSLSVGSVQKVMGLGLELAGPLVGPRLDLGCSLGRTTFLSAAQTEDLCLGVDLNFTMLSTAGRILRGGEVSYDRRRLGIVYDPVRFGVTLPQADRVDFWLVDAATPPFADGMFSMVSSLNLLDCLPSPAGHAEVVAQLLRAGGRAVVCTPYDWAPHATAIEGWLGGHSQRGPDRGASEPVFHNLLVQAGFSTVALRDRVPWNIRLHARSSMSYEVELWVGERS